MGIILTLIMGVSIGFVIAAITMANKVAEYEEENTKLKSELADRKSH